MSKIIFTMAMISNILIVFVFIRPFLTNFPVTNLDIKYGEVLISGLDSILIDKHKLVLVN